MHCDYWGLTHDPFRTHGPDRAWFPAGDHDEALSRMLYVIDRRHRCGIIGGASGLGKSRLLRELRRQIPKASTKIVSVDLTGLNRADFAITLANACGAGFTSVDPSAAAWTFLEDWLRGRTAVEGRVVWLLDELDAAAESLEPDLLRLIRLAERMRTASTLILALQRPGLTMQLGSIADFSVEIPPWSPDESREFIEHSLIAAGGTAEIISEEAWEIFLDAAEGSPQRLMKLAEIALIAGSVTEVAQLTADLFEAIVHQLGWEATERSHMLVVN